MRRLAGALAATVACAVAAGQDPVARFDRAYAEAERVRAGGDATADDVRAAHQRALQWFLRIAPDDVGYAVRLPAGAFCAHLSGELAMAGRLYEDALRDRPDDPFLVEWRLRAVLESAGAGTALDEAAARRAACPQGVRAFVVAARGIDRGALFEEAARRLRSGALEAGLSPFREAAEATGDPIDLANLALSLRFVGRLDEALGLYERALQVAPADDVLWNDYGLCLKAAGRVDDAIGAFRRSVAHEASPGSGPGWTNLALLARRGRPDALPDLVEGLRTVLRERPAQELCRRLMAAEAVRRAALAAGRSPQRP